MQFTKTSWKLTPCLRPAMLAMLIGVSLIAVSGGKARGRGLDGGLAPEDLFTALKNSPFSASELPGGIWFDATRSLTAADGFRDDAIDRFGAVGWIWNQNRVIAGSPSIWYYVFPLTSNAESFVADWRHRFPPGGNVTVSGLAASCYVDDAIGFRCSVVSDNVAVIAFGGGNSEVGKALLTSGLLHLQRVIANGTPAGIPASAIRPDVPGKETAQPAGGGAWRYTSAPPALLLHTGATTLSDGRVLVAAESDFGTDPRQNVFVFDPAAESWSAVAGLTESYGFHTQSLLSDGRVLVLGGGYQPIGAFPGPCPCPVPRAPAAELFDPGTAIWSIVPFSKDCGGDGHTATLLRNGLVLVVGGGCIKNDLHAPARLFDPDTGSWTETGPMLLGERTGHTATLLMDGRVLIVGGTSGTHRQIASDVVTSEFTNTAELYDPASNSWSDAGTVGTSWVNHTATLLHDGRVLIAGDGGNGVTAALFDPFSNGWSVTTSMSTPRYYHTATLLSDGRVLVAGGQTSMDKPGVPSPLDTAELFDPATESWSPTGSLKAPRSKHSAALLSDGTVLVVGGECVLPCLAPRTAEIFQP